MSLTKDACQNNKVDDSVGKLNSQVLLMQLGKNDTLVTDKQPKYSIIGCFDNMSLSIAESFEDILGTGNNVISDNLLHKISLFSSSKEHEDQYMYQNLVAMLDKGLTLVSMFKLAPFALSEYNSGVDMVTNIQNDILKISKKFNDVRGSDRAEAIVFSSLSSYDFIVFFDAADINVSIEFLVCIRERLADKIMFSTSLIVLSTEMNINDYKCYANTPAKILINCGFKRVVRISDLKKVFEDRLDGLHETTESDTMSADKPKTQVKVCFITGDDDAQIEISSTLFEIIKLYHPQSKSSLYNPSDEWMKNHIGNMQSMYVFGDEHRQKNCDEPPTIFSADYYNKALRQADRISEIFEKTKKLFSENLFPYISQTTRQTINSILTICSHLNSQFHHVLTARKILQLLYTALKIMDNDLNHFCQKQKYEPLLSLFIRDLSFSMPSIINTSSIYLDSVIDLSETTPYSKLIFAYEHVATEIIYCSSQTQNDKCHFDLFLTLNNSISLNTIPYFRFSDKDKQEQYLLSLNLPTPAYFWLKRSYGILLHEMAHYQKHEESSKKKHECILDTIFLYIANTFVDSIEKSYGYTMSEEETNIVLMDVHNIFRAADTCIDKNENNTTVFMDNVVDTLGDMREVVHFYIAMLDRDIKNDWTIEKRDYFIQYDEVLQRLDEQRHEYAYLLSRIIKESRADALMVLMGDYSLLEYLNILSSNFQNIYVDPKGDSGFLYRIAMVLRFFETKEGKSINVLMSEMFNNTVDTDVKRLASYYVDEFERVKNLTEPFVKYIIGRQKINLNDNLKQTWSAYACSKNRPSEYTVSEEVQFYLNHWFAQMIKYEEDDSVG